MPRSFHCQFNLGNKLPVDQGVTVQVPISAVQHCTGVMALWQVPWQYLCCLISFELEDSCNPNKPPRNEVSFLAHHSPALCKPGCFWSCQEL